MDSLILMFSFLLLCCTSGQRSCRTVHSIFGSRQSSGGQGGSATSNAAAQQRPLTPTPTKETKLFKVTNSESVTPYLTSGMSVTSAQVPVVTSDPNLRPPSQVIFYYSIFYIDGKYVTFVLLCASMHFLK
jgi:hypothetical protein